jgi:radical SAM superfamily enzyme YgiQ (UPF0313 family)
MPDFLDTPPLRRSPKVLLLYPPMQADPGALPKPNGSLAYPCLAAALLAHGVETRIFDACVGNDKDRLEEVFYRATPLPNGLARTGVSDARILEEAAWADIVGLTSIFSAQESITLATARLLKTAFPDKLLVAGGVNARCRREKFLDAGVDIVCLSEAEATLCAIADALAGRGSWADLHGVAYRQNGQTALRPTRPEDVVQDLDRLPIPAWHLLPNQAYWTIARPHGRLPAGRNVRYGSMMTSLGCVFNCSFCHIAGETADDLCGDIRRYRIKSDARVLQELDTLKRLGVEQVYLEDDTFFGRKARALRLVRQIRAEGVDILDVNGVNVAHLLAKGEPDLELLDALQEARFKELTLPFESGSQRILKAYASNKWRIEGSNIAGLIRECLRRGIAVTGNYMMGFPDETREEIQVTIAMAKQHMAAGLEVANFHIVLPLPGTPLYDLAVREGYLPADFDMDRMSWRKANLVRTAVPPAELEALRNRAWEECNRSKRPG